MRIVPLGGAHEVGASSTIVEFGRHRMLVDAGIRIGAHDGDQLPDLSRIQQEAGDLSAIFLTHAHMDHSGALPLVHMAYPHVPIYMTPATAAVVRILLGDSLRLMEGRYDQEGEIPLYPPEAVASCMGCIRPIGFDFPIRIADGDVSATFHPAGHILGASSISLRGATGSILISGDISVTDQRTIPGMLPPSIDADVVMIESTYGDRLHAHRPTQEAELIRTVAEIVESGGKVIFPAFAVGRAQEIILILRHAMACGELPPFPVFVDGMVQSVCDAYSRFPTYLQQHLRLSMQKGGNPFFPANGTIYRVRTPQQRRNVLEGPPCCIIASSGMMTGGPSAYYASHLADNRSNLIAITGYQDEEAPGRRLLDLADAIPSERRLKINDRNIDVRCRVEKYALSAHADSGEIAGLLGQISPSQGVVLVHGDSHARNALASTIDRVVGARVHVPGNGEEIIFRPSSRVYYSPRRQVSVPRIGGSQQPLDTRAISHLHQSLWAESGRQVLYRLSDLYARWYGPNATPTEDELHDLKALVNAETSLFEPDARRAHLFRLRSPKSIQREATPEEPTTGIYEMNRALQCVSEFFPSEEDDGLYKKGARQEDRTLVLYFRFPKIAQTRYQDRLEELGQKTGWAVHINDMPHHAALESLARQLLPADWQLARNPAIFHESHTVRIRLYPPDTEEITYQREAEDICQQYAETAGYQLEIHWNKRPQKMAAPQTPPQLATTEETRLEINRAYEYIEQAFATLPDQPYKKSKKGESVVLSFLSPIVAERYADTIDALSKDIGWPISINQEPNQYGIKQELRTLMPAHWRVSGEPGVLKRQGIVRLRLLQIPQHEELQQIAEQMYQRTGFHLEVAAVDA